MIPSADADVEINFLVFSLLQLMVFLELGVLVILFDRLLPSLESTDDRKLSLQRPLVSGELRLHLVSTPLPFYFDSLGNSPI